MENLLAPKQAAEYLGIKPRTLEVHRYRGTGPRYRKIGRLVRYTGADLQEYADRDISATVGCIKDVR